MAGKRPAHLKPPKHWAKGPPAPDPGEAPPADEHGGLMLGPAARSILRGEESVELVLPPKRERSRRRDRDAADHPDDPLFDALRECRRDLARAQGVPPYVIFHDSTLREMAALRPVTTGGLAQVSGVGERKLDAYGEAFLKVLKGFEG